MRDAVRDPLLPLEQQALARRAADHLVNSATDLNEGQLRQATRTVESHVSSMLQKTGRATREQLPSVGSAED
jgi:hypothetical protein